MCGLTVALNVSCVLGNCVIDVHFVNTEKHFIMKLVQNDTENETIRYVSSLNLIISS